MFSPTHSPTPTGLLTQRRRRLLFGGVLWLGVTSCGPSTETAAEPRLVPASAFNPSSDPREAFRFVEDDAARERASRREPPRCEFRVESVARGAAVDFHSSTIPKADLREQVARVADAFNAYRSATHARLDQLGAADHDWKMLLELRPEASVMDTSDGVRLVLEDRGGQNLLELRARVRWYAAGLLPDPVLEQRRPDPRQCLMDPPKF